MALAMIWWDLFIDTPLYLYIGWYVIARYIGFALTTIFDLVMDIWIQ